MVIDFSDLKQAVKEWVVDPMDHAFLYHTKSERETAPPLSH
nr:6-carboxytetrahydropterin synthase [Oligella ureolytica]